jgi:hypothetical protein
MTSKEVLDAPAPDIFSENLPMGQGPLLGSSKVTRLMPLGTSLTWVLSMAMSMEV